MTSEDLSSQSASAAAAAKRAPEPLLAHLQSEHARLYALLDKVMQALVRQASPDEVNAILVQLRGYALKHFREEEDLMRMFCYPRLTEHREYHQKIALQIQQLHDLTSKKDALEGALNTLHRWIDEHLSTADIDFERFVGAVGGGNSAAPKLR